MPQPQPSENQTFDLFAAPSKDELVQAKLMAEPSSDDIHRAQLAQMPVKDRAKSLLYEAFVTGHPNDPKKEPIEPTTAAEILAPGAMSSSASESTVANAKKIVGAIMGGAAAKSGWHGLGAIMRRIGH